MVTFLKTMPRSEKRRITKRIRDEKTRQERRIERLRRAADKGQKVQLRFSSEDDPTGRLQQAQKQLQQNYLPNLKQLLPALFNLNGDPYTIDDFFPFEPFYNTRLARSTIWKTGRQVAKCGRADSEFNHIYDEYGRRYRLADIETGQAVQSFDTDTFRSRTNRVLFQYDNPVKTCYYIRTRRGVEMELAGTHPLYTYNGWTPVDDLDIGDRIIHVRKGGKFGRKRVDDRRIRITAYMLGDGSFRGNYRFTASRNTQSIAEMRELLVDYCEYRDKRGKANSLDINRDHILHGWAREDQLHGKLSHEKTIPDWVFLLSRVDTRTFIERLWATDGSIKRDGKKASITYTSTSRELVYDLKSLLAKFGIPVSVEEKTGAYTKPDGRRVECHRYWRLRVETLEGWQAFLDEFNVPDKPGFSLESRESNNNRYTAPIEICELIADLAGECRGKNRQRAVVEALHVHGLRRKPKYPPSQEKLRQYLEFFRKHRADHPRLPEFEKYVTGDADWDEIVEIRNIGKHKCADIEVEGFHCYLFDGILSHNSTNQASSGVLLSNLIPYFNTLFVTPLFELIRRFSSNYVRPFIDESPIRPLLVDSQCVNSVLQRSFRNRSTMFFSFAFHDADRTRGLNCSKVAYDEVQDLDPKFIPIIREVMSASKWKISQFTGTPKTFDNTVEQLWSDSSQAEWIIRCGCGKDNIPSAEHDLEKMLGPTYVTRKISEEFPAVVCAKCGRPVNPREGFWEHNKPDLRFLFAGFHIPQIIMPMHYAERDAWMILQGKRQGFGRTPYNVFLNEVCGESADIGAKLITETDLKRAATLHENKIEEALRVIGQYKQRIISVDWGGGGEDEISYTALAVLGIRPDNRVDVIYGWRSPTPNDPIREVIMVLQLMRQFRCSHLVHDFGGAGNLRNAIIEQSGLPPNRLLPVAYVRANVGPMVMFKPFNDRTGKRAYFQMDKTYSLQYTCELIKHQFIRTFAYDNKGADDPGLLRDFLSLVADEVDSRTGTNIFTIIRNEKIGPDDFADAVNMGACMLFHANDFWPDIAMMTNLHVSAELLNSIAPIHEMTWEDWL